MLVGLCLAVAGVCLQLTGSPGAEGAPGRTVAESQGQSVAGETLRPYAAAPSAAVPSVVVPTVTGRPTSGVSVPAIPKKQTPAARPGVPSLIAIARLGVVAPVVPIKAEQGSLTPPANPRQVGWWSAGALPGARRGSAVIAGHTVHDGGGSFDDLERLQFGDVVVVSTSRGSVKYRVTGVTTYRKQAFARSATEVFDQSRPGRLVLVTCEDWTGKIYLSNVVVVAQPMA